MQQVTISADTDFRYVIGSKVFELQGDFTYGELEWLGEVEKRIQPTPNPSGGGEKKNELSGTFTREEIKTTLKILLKDTEGNNFTDEDFQNTREIQSVKIIADFFLLNAMKGAIIKSCSMN